MIYKFKKDGVDFEVELIQDLDNGKVLSEHIVLSVNDFDTDEWNSIHLNKKDVYHLIGALHLLHKEMK